MNWPAWRRKLPFLNELGERQRIKLADAIFRAEHVCRICDEPLGAPVWDEGEWIPDSGHLTWCPVLVPASDAMIREWLNIWDSLHAVGYAGDYCEPIPKFGEVVA